MAASATVPDDIAAVLHFLALPSADRLIYIAIGCAQGRYAPGLHTAQEYPPFIRDFHATKKVIILIDPDLEDPPRAFADNPDLPPSVTFFQIRRPLYWDPTFPVHPHGIVGDLFMRAILDLRRPSDYVVVQDYTGADIATHDPQIPGRVLYDATYGDYGCFVDFNKYPRIPRDPTTGDILHLDRFPLQAIPRTEYPELYRRQAEARASDLRYYIHRYIRVLRGQTPAADWCAPSVVAHKQVRLNSIYQSATLPHVDFPPSLRDLMTLAAEMLRDFDVPASEIPALLEDPTGERLSKAITDAKRPPQ